jgi:hypothetical protein
VDLEETVMNVVVIPIQCACGHSFQVECEAHPGQVRSGFHEVPCPACSKRYEVPDVPQRVLSNNPSQD